MKDELYIPEKNLRAGIAYLYRQYYRFPEIPDPVERVKFALASYNGGRGYINAALSLARSRVPSLARVELYQIVSGPSRVPG